MRANFSLFLDKPTFNISLFSCLTSPRTGIKKIVKQHHCWAVLRGEVDLVLLGDDGSSTWSEELDEVALAHVFQHQVDCVRLHDPDQGHQVWVTHRPVLDSMEHVHLTIQECLIQARWWDKVKSEIVANFYDVCESTITRN